MYLRPQEIGTLSSSSRRVYDTARQPEHLSNKNLKANK